MESHHLLFELLFRHSYGFDKLGFQHLLFRELCEVLRHMDAGFAEFQQFNQAVALLRTKNEGLEVGKYCRFEVFLRISI